MKTNKKLKLLISISAAVFLLIGTGVVLRYVILRSIQGKIQESFEYSHLHLSFVPPSLILEDVRTHSQSPFFHAEKITIKVSYKSLISRTKPINVVVEHPLLKLYETSEKGVESEDVKSNLSLPFIIEKGEIKGGEFHFFGKKESFQSKEIDALFVRKKDFFSLRAEAKKNILSLNSTHPQLEAKVSLLADSSGEKINIKRIRINGSDFFLDAEGSLLDPLNPEFSLKTSFKAKTPLIIDLLNLPFEWEGEAEGKGSLTRKNGEISFKADFSSDNLVLNSVFMGKVDGGVDFNNKSGGAVEFNIQKEESQREYVRIQFAGKKVEGVVRGFYLDPIINYVSLPWPVASPAWGNFTLDNRKLRADAEFRDEYFRVEPGLFPFRGKVIFDWDGKNRFSFSSPDLSTGFAHVNVEGDVEIDQEVDVTIQGDIMDVKQARQFTSLILEKDFGIPEIRGKGEAKFRIFGDYDFLQVQADFALSPGGFDKFDVYAAEGDVELIGNDVSGRVKIDDPFIKGKINFFSNQEGLKTDIQLERGFVEKIFPALDINLPFQGEASGNFKLKQKNGDVQVEGDFSSPLLKITSQTAKDLKGKLKWKGNVLTLSEIQFLLHEGTIKGNAIVGVSSQEFDLDIQGKGIDLSSLYGSINGVLGFNLKGKGLFGKDMASGSFKIMDLEFSPFQKTEAEGKAKLGYSEEKLYLELNGNFLPGENEFNGSLTFPFNETTFSIDIRGNFNNLDLLLPWKDAKGRLNYLAEVRGEKVSPQIKGAIDFQGAVFPLPKFAHAFRDYSGLMFVDNGKVSIRSLQAKLGGGDIQGSGELYIGKGGVENINFKMEGKNLLLSPLERTRALTEGSLSLIKDPNRFVLEGNFLVHRLSWRRELNEKFVFSSSPYYQSQEEPGFFDDLTLNIRLKADDDAWMENSLGRVRGRFDLNITGNVNSPIVMGDIEALDGNVYFQDRKFKILSGRVSFFNPLTIKPHLSFQGETYVKDYRVTFSLDGLIDHLNPEFSSSPPLPPEDVLALLALGESFKRTYSYDTSTRLSTASLLSFQLSEEAKKRAEGLFTIDRFRIDPFVLGSSTQMAARLTVGKKISRNFFILYSTNLTTQREEITRLEWELTDDLSIVGTRDEEGRISIDVKIHKRF